MSDQAVGIRCDKCKLYETSKASLYGIQYHRSLINDEGIEGAPIMFVGEAPGSEEIIKDKPFVGDAGKQLRASLEKVGIKNFYVSNVVRCRPPENKTPTPAQVSSCSKLHLYKTIERVKPKVLVLLGNVALKEVLGFSGITKLAGKVFQSEKVGVPCIPVVHPSYVIRNAFNPLVLSSFEESLRAVKAVVDYDRDIVNPEAGCKYVTVSTMEQIDRLFKKLLEVEGFSYDLETSGFDWIEDKILCMSFSWKERTGVVIPFYHSNPNYMEDHKLVPFWQDSDKKKIVEGLRKILQRRVWRYYNNGKFDNKFLIGSFGIDPIGPLKLPLYLFDNMLAHHLLDENVAHDLDSMVLQYTDMGLYSKDIKKYLTSKETSFAVIPQEVLWKYSAKDADAEFRVGKLFQPMIEKEGLHDLFYKIVMPYSKVLESMELNGAKIDLKRLQEIAKDYVSRIKKVEKELETLPEVGRTVEALKVKAKMKLQGRYDALKRKSVTFEAYWSSYIEKHPIAFNPRSVPQVRCLLYEICQVTRRMTGGSLTTDEKVLNIIKGQVKPAKHLLELRKLNKFYGTYVKNIPGLVKKDGRLHTTYLQHGTVTGRLSSRKPNFQNQPKRGEEAKLIRSYFIPEPGNILIEADYKGDHLRSWSFYSQDTNLINDLHSGLDIISHVASYVLKKPIEDVTEYERFVAKMTVYGIIFGRGPKSIAEEYGIPEERAAAIIRYFLDRYSVAAKWIDNQKLKALKNGYVVSYFGRKRRLSVLEGIDYKTKVCTEGRAGQLLFSDLSFEEAEALRQSINSPIQGMCHDIISIAGTRLLKVIEEKKLPIMILMDIHDAFLVECPIGMAYEAALLMKDSMERRIKDINVRLEVDFMSSTTRWSDMEDVTLDELKLISEK